MKKKANRPLAICRFVLSTWVVFAGFIAVASAQEPATAPSQWQVTDLEGKSQKISELTVDAQGKVQGPGLAAPLGLDDLHSIALIGARVAPGKPGVIAELPAGGRLFAEGVSLASEKLKFLVHGREVTLPIDAVRAIRLAAGDTHVPFDTALANPSADEDSIFFRAEDRNIVSATGLTETFSKDSLTFDFNGTTKTLDRDLVWGIVFAGTPSAVMNQTPATVHTIDGAALPGKLVSADSQQVTLALGATEISLPWSLVTRIDFRSSRVAYLSDLKPVFQEHTPLVTSPLPPLPDQNVLRQPLKLGSTTYEKGWGTHAQARLDFDTGEGYDLLLGMIGHDPFTRGRGDCVIVVQGDGRELFSSRLRGSDPPLELRVVISNVKKVSLQVEPGEDLDLADHVNWCDLRFLRQASQEP